ncbi:MAG: hypothetical protein ACRD3C_24035 [Vicinamibacterales bacterium]
MRCRRVWRSLALGLVVSCVAAPAGAQQDVAFEFRDGRVTLSAQDVSLSRILEEWARVGGTHILNGDNLPRSSVTMQFTGVLESQVLGVLLEGVAGYIASKRPPAHAGTSSFERILIVPTSSPVPAAPVDPIPQPRLGVRLPPPPFVRARATRPDQPGGNADPAPDDATIPVWMPDFARPAGTRTAPPAVAPPPNPNQPRARP